MIKLEQLLNKKNFKKYYLDKLMENVFKNMFNDIKFIKWIQCDKKYSEEIYFIY